MMAAAGRGHSDVVRLLLGIHADLERREVVNGFTALIGAIAEGHTDAARLLVEAGADVNAKAHFERTALMAAAASGATQIVELLIARGADVSARETQRGWTVLTGAERNGHSDVVRLLKAAGA